VTRYYQYDTMPAGDLERVECAVCASEDCNVLGPDGGFTVVKCRRCGFVYVNPRPTAAQLVKLYRDYYPEGADVPDRWAHEMGAIFAECRDWLCAWRAVGAVLDIGCSYGHLLQSMEERGWSTVGIEPSPDAARYAREHTRGQILETTLETVDLPAATFDAVVSLYVLEHVRDPRGFLAKVADVLRPGGVAILRVPHSEPLFGLNRLLRRPLIGAPMHLNDFSPTTLHRLATDVGFERVEAHVGRGRRSHDVIEHLGALVFGGTGRIIERLSGGRLLLPWVGALTYRLWTAPEGRESAATGRQRRE
jgi:SAM-dependent methyltransferase